MNMCISKQHIFKILYLSTIESFANLHQVATCMIKPDTNNIYGLTSLIPLKDGPQEVCLIFDYFKCYSITINNTIVPIFFVVDSITRSGNNLETGF